MPREKKTKENKDKIKGSKAKKVSSAKNLKKGKVSKSVVKKSAKSARAKKRSSSKEKKNIKNELVVNVKDRFDDKDAARLKKKELNPTMMRLETPGEIKEKRRTEKKQRRQDKITAKRIQKGKNKKSNTVYVITGHDKNEVKEKRVVMWLGVSFFMIMIVFFWVITIRQTVVQNPEVNENDDWRDIKNELTETMEKAIDNWDETKSAAKNELTSIEEEIATSSEENAGIEADSNSTSSEGVLSDEDIFKMQKMLVEKSNNASSSEEQIN